MAVVTGSFRVFPQSLQVNAVIVILRKPRPISFLFFPIRQALIIGSFDAADQLILAIENFVK
jgi:hypothetical protein